MGNYLSYVKENNLPNKWVFPTYFLYLCHPDKNIFVKPKYTKKYLEFFGKRKNYSATPSRETYELILGIAKKLKTALSVYQPRNMVDIQSFLWVMVHSLEKQSENSTKDGKKLAKPFSEMFKDYDQAVIAFDLLGTVVNKIYNKINKEELLSITLRPFKNGYMLRVNLGNWLVFGINGKPDGIYSYHFLQPTERLGSYVTDAGKFTQNESELQISLVEILVSDYLIFSMNY